LRLRVFAVQMQLCSVGFVLAAFFAANALWRA